MAMSLWPHFLIHPRYDSMWQTHLTFLMQSDCQYWYMYTALSTLHTGDIWKVFRSSITVTKSWRVYGTVLICIFLCMLLSRVDHHVLAHSSHSTSRENVSHISVSSKINRNIDITKWKPLYCTLAELPIARWAIQLLDLWYRTSNTRPLLQHVVQKVSAFAVSSRGCHAKNTLRCHISKGIVNSLALHVTECLAVQEYKII